MAEGVDDPLSLSVKKLDAELTCPVCTEHFKEPKVLPCLHYYCKTCIADLIKRANGQPFNCPECRREAQAGGNDPESFPTAFFLNRMEDIYSVMKKADPKQSSNCESCSELPSVSFCYDCKEYICTDCVRYHQRIHKLSTHRVVSIESLRSNISKYPADTHTEVVKCTMVCNKHEDEPLKLYCRDCCKLVCRDCVLIDHKDHKYTFVTDTAPLSKTDITKRCEAVKKLSEDLSSVVSSLTNSDKKLNDDETATKQTIDGAIDDVIAKAEEKRRELKEKAGRIVSEAREKVSTQKKNAELAVGEVESLVEFMNRTLERATDQEVLSLEKQMSDQVERVSQLYGNPADKFPVPTLPELVVDGGSSAANAIATNMSVSQKETKKCREKGSFTVHSQHESMMKQPGLVPQSSGYPANNEWMEQQSSECSKSDWMKQPVALKSSSEYATSGQIKPPVALKSSSGYATSDWMDQPVALKSSSEYATSGQIKPPVALKSSSGYATSGQMEQPVALKSSSGYAASGQIKPPVALASSSGYATSDWMEQPVALASSSEYAASGQIKPPVALKSSSGYATSGQMEQPVALKSSSGYAASGQIKQPVALMSSSGYAASGQIKQPVALMSSSGYAASGQMKQPVALASSSEYAAGGQIKQPDALMFSSGYATSGQMKQPVALVSSSGYATSGQIKPPVALVSSSGYATSGQIKLPVALKSSSECSKSDWMKQPVALKSSSGCFKSGRMEQHVWSLYADHTELMVYRMCTFNALWNTCSGIVSPI